MKIFLQAYLNNNVGDDMMIDFICKRYPQHDFFVMNINCLKQIACQNENLHIINSIIPTKKQIFLRLFNKGLSYFGIPKIQLILYFRKNKYDVNFELGGSIFKQVTFKSWMNKIRDANVIIDHCNYNIISGCNFGPYYTNDFLSEHKKLFKKYNSISFRDAYSYNLFPNYSNTSLYSDIVFCTYFPPKKKCKNLIGISVTNLNNSEFKKYADYYIKGMIEIINILTKDNDIVLLSFCKNEGDTEACQIIKNKCQRKDAISIYEHNDVSKTKDLIGNIRAMICTRFHANILAIKQKIPFVPVIYSNKTQCMLDDLNFIGYRWNIMNSEKADISKIIRQLNTIPKVNYNKTEDALGHVKYLDSILM